jgi:cell division septation protein DedD
MSPEELALKREEGVRIARSVAVDRALAAARDGIALEKIAPLAQQIEGYLLTGKFPSTGNAQGVEKPPVSSKPRPAPAPVPAPTDVQKETPTKPSEKEMPQPSTASRTRRPDPKTVNALFNEAKVAGLVTDWNAYLTLCRGVVRSQVKSPYGLTTQEFAKVESDLRGRLARGKVA